MNKWDTLSSLLTCSIFHSSWCEGSPMPAVLRCYYSRRLWWRWWSLDVVYPLHRVPCTNICNQYTCRYRGQCRPNCWFSNCSWNILSNSKLYNMSSTYIYINHHSLCCCRSPTVVVNAVASSSNCSHDHPSPPLFNDPPPFPSPFLINTISQYMFIFIYLFIYICSHQHRICANG